MATSLGWFMKHKWSLKTGFFLSQQRRRDSDRSPDPCPWWVGKWWWDLLGLGRATKIHTALPEVVHQEDHQATDAGNTDVRHQTDRQNFRQGIRLYMARPCGLNPLKVQLQQLLNPIQRKDPKNLLEVCTVNYYLKLRDFQNFFKTASRLY